MPAVEFPNSAPDTVYLNHKCYTVGRKIASGGQGKVHLLPEFPGKVLKLLDDPFTSASYHDHLQAIIRRQVPSAVDGYVIASLPEALAYTGDGRFVGYSMPRIRSRLMLYNIWIDPEGYFRHFPLDDRYAVAYNLAEAMDHLHRHGLVMGDVNPANIVMRADGTLTLCDLGGCTVTDPVTGICFGDSVGMVDYLAPEVYREGTSRVQFTPHSDSFSLAVLIFQIITLGCHPFNTARVNFDENRYSSYGYFGNDEHMNGSPYFTTVPNRRIPEYAKPYLGGLEPFYSLFQRAFGYSADDACSPGRIAQRPSPREWMEALKMQLSDRS